MSQSTIVEACGHGYLPGSCKVAECWCSERARRAYLVPTPAPESLPPPTFTLFDAPSPPRMRALRIANVVSAEYDIALPDLLGDHRHSELIEPRHVLYWLCRYVGCWAYPSIGRALKRDHSTVMKGSGKIERRRQVDPLFSVRLAKLVATVNGFEGGV